MDLEHSLLVVVDLQNGFVRDESRHVVPAVVDLVQHWTAAGGALLLTRFVNAPGSAHERVLRWDRLRTAPDTDLVAELAPYAGGLVVEKGLYTVFSPAGRAAIEAGGWTDLVFCGIATDSCILKSATDAFESGYTPWIVRDACASHGGPAAHDAGLLVAGRMVGRDQVVTASEVMEAVHAAA